MRQQRPRKPSLRELGYLGAVITVEGGEHTQDLEVLAVLTQDDYKRLCEKVATDPRGGFVSAGHSPFLALPAGQLIRSVVLERATVHHIVTGDTQ